MCLMKSQTHSPARLTSSRCAGSALTDGIAMNSFSSLRQVSSMGRDSTQVVRAAAEGCGFVSGVEQAAGLQRQAAAADARVQPRTNRLEGRDPLVELSGPAAREPLPVTLGGLPVRQCVECRANPLERDAGDPARLHERDAAKGDARIPPLIAVRPARVDEPLPLVEAERGLRHAAAGGELTDAHADYHLT